MICALLCLGSAFVGFVLGGLLLAMLALAKER